MRWRKRRCRSIESDTAAGSMREQAVVDVGSQRKHKADDNQGREEEHKDGRIRRKRH